MPIIRWIKQKWWVFDYPATSHWAVVSVFFFRQSSTDKPCVSVGLVSRLASPNSLHRRDNQPYCLRIALTRTLHQRSYVSIQFTHPSSELHRSLAGGAGVSSPPIIIRSALDHVYHLQSFLGNSYKVCESHIQRKGTNLKLRWSIRVRE